MKVLFFMRSTVYVRNFETTLRLLAERGHDVHIVAQPNHKADPSDLAGRLCQELPRITQSAPPQDDGDAWSRLGIELRRGIDGLRYLGPEYRDSPKMRHRAERKTPAFVTSALTRPLVNTAAGRSLLARAVRACDRALPTNVAADAFIRAHRPDLVLVTPLVEPGSPQSVYVRSARALGIPTGLCVYSWDNLTNKGLIQDELDVVTVWNQPMKDEAVTLHGVPAKRVVVTGAPAYDHWFSWSVRETRQAFCGRVGLRPDRPYLLYLCSSKFISYNERPFVTAWIARLRASSDFLRDVGVLVRPHPQNPGAWKDADLGDLDNVAVWPRVGGNPVDTDSRAGYYDSIHHSAAVMGLNTSAQIESAIVGRSSHTLLTPEFRETQEGTLHFRHLCEVNGGLLHVATDYAQHIAQLEAAVRDPHAAADRCRRFVEAFVRPHGLDRAASPRLVDTLEATVARRVRPDHAPWWAPLVRPALARAATSVQEADRVEQARKAEEAAKAATRKAAREPGERDVTPRSGQPETAPSGPLVALDVTEAEHAYRRFLDVRTRVCAMREPDAEDATTPSERRMLSSLNALWDAGPEAVARLRRYGEAVTGVRASDYENPKATAQPRLEHELGRLLESGDRLWLDEPMTLGGFGFDGLGKRFNEDTLRFFRVISLLEDAAVLRDFRDGGPRRTVWEIGGGWGGFAHYFKTLCPNVTYLITAAPAQLLLAAAYLTIQRPTAGFRFYDRADPDAFWRDWNLVDFAFAPENALPGLRPPSLGLTVDVAALERMSPERISPRVKRAHELGSRYFVSVCPAEEPEPELGSPVRPAVERWYWPHPLSAPLYLSKRLAVRAGRQVPFRRTYLLGWRRLHA